MRLAGRDDDRLCTRSQTSCALPWESRAGRFSDIQLAHDESDDITMNRALGVLNGQILTAVEIEPGSRTRFSFDLGCSFRTCPAPPGSYRTEPVEQWRWDTRSGPVLLVRGDGTYAVSSPHAKADDDQWLPITTPVSITAPA